MNLVRTQISVLDRFTLEAMIVLDVHNRDCVQSLANQKVEKISDFAWQAQVYIFI